MKSTILSLCVVLLPTLGSAGVVTGTNLDQLDGTDYAVVDNLGNPIAPGSGVIAFGYFRTLSDSAVDLATGGTSSVYALDFQVVTTGDFLDPGLYFGSYDYGRGFLDDDAGKSFYTFIGNGDDLLTSDQFLIYRHNDIVDADATTPVPDNNELVLGDGQLIVGLLGGSIIIDAENTVGSPTEFLTIHLEAIPEPGTAALGLMGGLFLLRRRR